METVQYVKFTTDGLNSLAGIIDETTRGKLVTNADTGKNDILVLEGGGYGVFPNNILQGIEADWVETDHDYVPNSTNNAEEEYDDPDEYDEDDTTGQFEEQFDSRNEELVVEKPWHEYAGLDIPPVTYVTKTVEEFFRGLQIPYL